MAEENRQNNSQNTEGNAQQFEIAVLPLQNTTMFPNTVVPLAVGRERSVKAVEAALATEEKLIACLTIKNPDVNGSDAKPIDLAATEFRQLIDLGSGRPMVPLSRAAIPARRTLAS